MARNSLVRVLYGTVYYSISQDLLANPFGGGRTLRLHRN